MSDVYAEFLESFCCRNEETIRSEDERLLFDVRSEVADEEVEGECLDCCWQYLVSREKKCPLSLAVLISREVTSKIFGDSLVKQCLKDEKSYGSKTAEESKDTNAYHIDGSKLATEVLRITREVCKKWKKGLPSSVSELSEKNLLRVSDHAIKNTRRKMEDRHVIMPYLDQLAGLKLKSHNELHFYAVYDGHGGVEAAKYAAVHLHCHLACQLREEANGDISNSLKEAFLKTDNLFVRYASQENISSGSTAVCAVIDDRRIHIAWLGDSLIMLVRNGKPVELMQPHKPEREDEKKRIEEMGGYVVWFGAWRVNGNLSVSRAIGDYNFKPFVSSTPDVTSLDRDPSDDYLVLACDGLWDVLSPIDLVNEVQLHLQKGEPRSTVAKRLTEIAKDRGSSDNISVIVVFLRDNLTVQSQKRDSVVKEEAGSREKEEGPEPHDDVERREGRSTGSGGSNLAEQRDDGDCSGTNKQTENSRLTLRTEMPAEFLQLEGLPQNITVLSENEHCDLDSSGDLPLLSEDSNKNVLDPSKVHSSDDTNGQNISGDLYCGVVDYKLSPQSHGADDKSHGSDASLSLEDDLQLLPEVHSDTSAGETAPANSLGGSIHCSAHRTRRRRHSGNRRSRKENRRPSRDKIKTATPPCVHSISFDRKLDVSFRESCRSLSQTSSHLLKMLTGFGTRNPLQKPGCGFRSTNKDRWTIAVEVEDWATIFESNKPIGTTQAMNLSTHW